MKTRIKIPFHLPALGLRPLLMLLLLTLPAVGQAQFDYTTNNGTITITGYTGPGGAVVIPNTINGFQVTSIGENAFYGNASLTSVTIPNSVNSIGEYAFYFCTSLTSITVPNSVTSIGSGAFLSCISLSAIRVDDLNSFYISVDGVLFNKSQTLLIQYPGGKAGSYTIPNGVISIGNLAFYFCTGLSRVTIPNGVTNIGEYAFHSCTGLISATVPNSVTSLGVWAFAYCASLTSVTIPNRATSIGYSAFFSCTSLTNATIPNSVTSIGAYAFYYCSSLTSATIPNSVTSIGDDAFASCTSLTGVYFQGNAPGVGSEVFVGADNAIVYYLPGTTGWGAMFGGRPAVLWNPLIQISSPSFGVGPAGFGFKIIGTTNIPIVVEATTNLANGPWVAMKSLNLTNGASYFSDPNWTDYPARNYRIRSP